MNAEYLQTLIDGGYADEAAVVADAVYNGENAVLCINGEVVSLVKNDPPQKIFKDSIDRLSDVTVKSGLFKKTLAFTHNGVRYELAVKGGKNVLDYFKLIG